MRITILDLRAFAFMTGVALLTISSWASADPPSRVARLGYMTGAVSFSPAGEDDWIQASINRPLTTGDRLWADPGARTEIQIGGAVIRMNARTSVAILNLDDRIAQLQLTQGALNVRVRRLDPDQVFEVDTPNLAFTLRQPGEYRIEVDPEGDATTIVVRKGQGEAYGEGAAYIIDSRQPYRFTGTGLRDYQYADVRVDEFDRWSTDRDRRYDTSISARYVAPDVVGYQDLDANGTWGVDATYGNVWYPTRVASGWAPYRDGHWAWIDPWGWTWVDDAPWGFAVSHYGRWANVNQRWCWVPGPVRSRAYYAPALVAFVGGSNFSITIGGGNVGGVAWFPLGPRDVYRPSYAASRGYFENVNRSNTVINTTVINNYYNNTNVTNVVYANQQVPGAVVAVPTTAFVQSQPVSRAAVQVPREMAVSRTVAFVPSVVPTERSVRGAAAQGDKPPPRVFERPVVARTAPPAAPVGFAAQQQQLTARPGRPLEDAARKELKPAAAAPAAPAVRVVAQQAAPQPTMRPPPAAPGRSDQRQPPGAPMQGAAPAQATPPVPPSQAMPQRGDAGQPPQREQRGTTPVPPPAPPQVATPAPAAPPPTIARPAPTAQPPEQRGNAEQRGKGEQRGQPAAQPSAPPPVAMPAPSAPPPQVARPAPTAPPPEQRGNAEQRGKGEQRGQPVAPPSAPPPAPPPAMAQPRAVPPQAAPPVPVPQAAPPAPATQAQEQRGKPEQREQRGQPAAPPPPQRVAAPQPQAAPPAPAMQPPPQRSAQPAPPQAAPVAPAAQPPQRGRPEPAPAAAPGSPPPAARAAPPGQEQKPAAGDPNDKKKDGDELKRGRS